MQRFDREASTWDENPFKTKLASDIARVMIEELNPGPNTDILEFGCGTGLVTLQLQPLVRSVLGIDNSTGMIGELNAKIRTRGIANVATRCMDIEKGDFLEDSFDLAVSSMAFHHIRDVKPLLHQLYSVLRPGGQIGIADLDLDDGQFHADNEGVFHFGFDRTALRHVFEEVGFVDIRDRLAVKIDNAPSGVTDRAFTIFLISATRPA